jgi:hypothetical protein
MTEVSRPIGRPRGVGITLLLFIITLGIYGFWWIYYQYRDFKEFTGEGLSPGAGVVIQIFIGVVNMFILPSQIESAYQRDGKASPVSAIWGLWFLLPLIGGIIWFVKVQGAINDYWVAHGASPA